MRAREWRKAGAGGQQQQTASRDQVSRDQRTGRLAADEKWLSPSPDFLQAGMSAARWEP